MSKTAVDLYDLNEVVSLRIDRALVIGLDGDVMAVTTDTNDEIVLNVSDPQVTVIRVRPADGEPRAGELWRDAIDSLWFAVRVHKEISLVGAEPDIQHGGRSRVGWLDVHRGITGPIRRVWHGEVDQAIEPVDPPGRPALEPVGPCPGDPHCRAGHRCPACQEQQA